MASIRQWAGLGLSGGTALTTASAGSGDTPFDEVYNSPQIVTTTGQAEIEIANVAASRTFRWNELDLSTWQLHFYFRLTGSSATSSGTPIFEARHAGGGLLYRLTLSTDDKITLLNSTNGYVGQSSSVAKGDRYRIVAWGTAGTINVRLYDSSGVLLWSRLDQGIGNTNNLDEVIFGRNGNVAYGPAYLSDFVLGDEAEEIPSDDQAPPLSFPMQWGGGGIADGTLLTTSLTGTDDTSFIAVSGDPVVRVIDGFREIEVPATSSAVTFRWTGVDLATWQVQFYFRLTDMSAESSGVPIFEARHASGLLFRLTLSTDDRVTLLSSSNSYISQSGSITKGDRYRIVAWGTAGVDSVNLKIFAPDESVFWLRIDQAVGDSSNLDQVLFGRNSSTMYGPALFSHIRLSDSAIEPEPHVSSSVFGYVLESDLTTLTPVQLVGELDSDLVTIHPLLGSFTTYSGPAPEVPRIYAKHPYGVDSIWNIPLHTGVTYSDSSDPRTNTYQALTGVLNGGTDWTLGIWQATESSPLVEIQADRDNGYPTFPVNGAYHRVPADGVVPGPVGDGSYNVQYDGWVTIISPDGTEAIDLYKAKWLTPGSVLQAAYAYQYPLDGTGGTDPLSGTPAGDGLRASNWPYLGGMLRIWEMSDTTIQPSQRIKHAIALAIPNSALQSGYVWPSRGQDADAGMQYSGTIPMGTCFALPPSYNIETSGLSQHGKALAYALKYYGGWIADRSSNATIFSEMNTPSALHSAYETAWNMIRPHMVAVDGRTAVLPGGSGTPLVPLSPEGQFGTIS